jgi:hypothetical protein
MELADAATGKDSRILACQVRSDFLNLAGPTEMGPENWSGACVFVEKLRLPI